MKKTTDTVLSAEEVTTAQQVETPAVDEDRIFVYLGPTIGGLIQKGTIYKAKDIDSIPDLALPLEKIPKIRQLIIEDIHIREIQQKLNSAENNSYTIAEKEIAKAAAALDVANK